MSPTRHGCFSSRCAGRQLIERTERGGGSVLMIGLLAVVMAMAWGATVIAGYLVAGHRATSIADLAALSGASAFAGGRDGCGTARRVAERQHAKAHCRQVGDQIDFVITVTAVVRVPAALPGLPTEVRAVGHAGPAASGEARREPIDEPSGGVR